MELAVRVLDHWTSGKSSNLIWQLGNSSSSNWTDLALISMVSNDDLHHETTLMCFREGNLTSSPHVVHIWLQVHQCGWIITVSRVQADFEIGKQILTFPSTPHERVFFLQKLLNNPNRLNMLDNLQLKSMQNCLCKKVLKISAISSLLKRELMYATKLII